MSWFGTDMMALACIVGSGAVGGAATLAAMGNHQQMDYHCVVEDAGANPEVMVVTGVRAPSVVVTRNVRVHASQDCQAAARHQIEIAGIQHRGHIVHLEALEHLEHLEHLEKMDFDFDFDFDFEELDVQLEGLDVQLEGLDAQLEAMGVGMEQEIQTRIEQELAQVQMQLKKRKR